MTLEEGTSSSSAEQEEKEEEVAKSISFWSSAHAILMNSSLNILLIAVFPCLICYYTGSAEYLTFIFAVLALAPLAERLSFTTEQLCLHTNDTIAGLLNVSFGNATELIVGIMALRYGLKRLIQLSLLGSVLSNSLLVLGSSFVVSGFQFKAIRFNAHLGHITSLQMVLAMASVVLGSVGYSFSESSALQELGYSRALAMGLLFVYAGFVFFQLVTHTKHYNVKEATGSMRWSDPLAVNYPGLASHEYSKSRKSVLYEPVPMTGDNESAESKLDDVREEQHDRILENEELVRKVQLEVSALHPEMHHSTHSSHHHSQSLGSNKTDDIENDIKQKDGFATHDESEDDEDDDEEDDEKEEDQLGFVNALIWLGIITVFISLVSNALADTIEEAASKLGISSNFLATIVLPILGNAAEHASAVIFGYKGKATLAMAIAVGSSIQIALFVFPLLIILGWMIGLNVDFDMGAFETMTLVVATVLPNVVLTVMKSTTVSEGKVLLGETTYFSGIVLVATYFLIAIGFYARNEESLDT